MIACKEGIALRLTALEKTKKGRYALFADGEFLFSIHRDSFALLPFGTGSEVDVQRLEQLRRDDQLLSAKAAALDALSRCSQTSGTLREKLLRHYDEEAVELAVERMTELGLVNDADYARRYAADCVNLRGWSLIRTRQALLQKKLHRDTVDAALEQFEAHDEADPIIKLLLGKYRGKLLERDDLRRTVAALQRRGFQYDDIRAALRKIEEEELYLD